MDKLKAKLIKGIENGDAEGVEKNRKDNLFCESYHALVFENKQIEEIVNLRLYVSKSGGTSRSCVWIKSKKQNTYRAGGGITGGYGWHINSGAAHNAIKAAGFQLSQSIAGVGNEGIEEALKAIVRCVGYPRKAIKIVHSFG